MEEEERLAKNQRIKDAQIATRARRKSMVCRTYEAKIDESHLSVSKKETIRRIFLEAKWFCNEAIAFMRDGHPLLDFDYKTTTVHVKLPDGSFDTRYITHLPAACRQALLAQLLSDLKGLDVADRKGRKTGEIHFKKRVTAIRLKQVNSSYAVDFDRSAIRVNGIPGYMRVRGLDQLPDEFEWSCARLIESPLGHFVKLTVYFNQKDKPATNGKSIGIDFGCSTAFTTSEGTKIRVSVKESKRLKRLSRKINRKQVKGSNRRYENIRLLNREYAKMTNRKDDAGNKIVHGLRQYDRIVIQDEQLSNWKKTGHGKAVQHSTLGRVKRQLLESPNIVVLDRWLPTTKLCVGCGQKYPMPESERVFRCGDCGIAEDRDIHAAKNMIWFADHNIGVIQLGTERTEVTRGEFGPLVSAAVKSDRDQDLTENREASCSSGKR